MFANVLTLCERLVGRHCQHTLGVLTMSPNQPLAWAMSVSRSMCMPKSRQFNRETRYKSSSIRQTSEPSYHAHPAYQNRHTQVAPWYKIHVTQAERGVDVMRDAAVMISVRSSATIMRLPDLFRQTKSSVLRARDVHKADVLLVLVTQIRHPASCIVFVTHHGEPKHIQGLLQRQWCPRHVRRALTASKPS